MTLHQQNEFLIPEETARVARAAYPKGNLYMKMRDALGTIANSGKNWRTANMSVA